MYDLTHWSIQETQTWLASGKLRTSYRIEGNITNHPQIRDGEYFYSGSDIRHMYIDYETENVIVTTQHSVYFCRKKDLFRENMQSKLLMLIEDSNAIREGLVVYISSEAEYLIQSVMERNQNFMNIAFVSSIPHNLQKVSVTCGESAVLFAVEKDSEYSSLHLDSDAPKRTVINIGKYPVRFWSGDRLIKLSKNEVFEDRFLETVKNDQNEI